MIKDVREIRKYIIGGIALGIVVVYLFRLFYLQIIEDRYRISADSNAFRKEITYPSRGLIKDRDGRLLVYNEPMYDIMVVMQEQLGTDTLDFCRTVGITPEDYKQRMAEIKDRSKNPGYSRYTPQLFLSHITPKEYSLLREKLFLFKGFSVQKRSVRRYTSNIAAHLLGDVAEVNTTDLERDDYYRVGDFIGKQGIERSYETWLRGEKGVRIMLRDVHGRTQGHYLDGATDVQPVPGHDLTLSIDSALQALAESLLEGKQGAIVAIEPATGEILCMASGPTFRLQDLTGKNRGKTHSALASDPRLPLINRAIMGMYPPGSTFKITQSLLGLQEGVITPSTAFPCSRGFNYKGLHLGCHGHGSPLPLVPAIATSCNGYFCWNLYRMFSDRKKYASNQAAMTVWKDYLVDMGFGYPLGVDLPGEKRGLIPNADFYDKHLGTRWNALSVISISIGQGEVTATPLQIANLAATVANRGYYIVPHVVRAVEGGEIDTLYQRRHVVGVDRQHYETAVRGMRSAVLGGTCRGASIPGYEVCGKTGTAQNRGHDHSAFMGFAPMKDPRIAVCVYIENGGFGATYGVPLGALIMEQWLNGELSPASQERARSFQHRHIL